MDVRDFVLNGKLQEGFVLYGGRHLLLDGGRHCVPCGGRHALVADAMWPWLHACGFAA
ncbi:hypothetical protein A2U01_0031109, partial [Trifolium medium]|nr:hypothetical protein [Trifolium medium]